MADIINLATFSLDTQKLQSSLNDLQDRFFDLRKAQKEYSEQSKDTAKQIELLTKSQNTLKASAGDNSQAIAENDKKLQSLLGTQRELYKSEQNLGIQMGTVRKEINQTTTQLRAYQDAEGKTNSLIDLGNAALGRQIKNKNDARAANIALNNVANQLNPNIEQENKLLIQLNAQMDKNTNFIKANASETAKQKMNIGNYTESIKQAISESGLMNSTLQSMGPAGQVAQIGFKQIGSAVNDVKNAFTNYRQAQEEVKAAQETFNALSVISTEATQAATIANETATRIGFEYATGTATRAEAEIAATAATVANTTATEAQATATVAATVVTNASSGAFKLFRIALISTGIGAIVVLLGSLIGFLTTTQSGINKLSAVLEPLKAIFFALGGVLSTIGGQLVSVFENPKKSLSELYEFVKGNLINRFKAFGVILDGILNLDFKKIANGALQAGTGVENLTGKIAAGAQRAGKFLDENVKKGQQVAALTKQMGEAQLKYNAAQVAVGDAIDKQLLISKDTSKSFQERAAAANEIIRLTEKNGTAEKAILLLELKRLQVQQSMKGNKNLSNEDKQETIELMKKIDAAEDRGLNARLEQSRVLSGLKKDEQDKAKANDEKAKQRQQEALDRALSQSKAEIDLFVANQGFKKKSSEEEYNFNNSLLEKESADLKKQLQAKKITQTEYEAQLQALKNDTMSKNADLMIENANLELDAQMSKNDAILANDKYLSDEQLRIKQEALTNQMNAEIKYQDLLLSTTKINQSDRDIAVAKIKADSKVKADELDAINKAAEQEKQLIDLENKKIIDGENFIVQAENEKAQNAIKLEQDLKAAEQSGADQQLIKDKYAQMDSDIDKAVMANKLNLASQTFGQLASILGENSKAGKAAAIAQATIDTYSGINKVWSTASVLPEPFATAQKVISTVVVAKSGFDSVKKITATKQPTFKKANYASGVIGLRGLGNGTSDDISANLSVGESVINAKSTSMFARELSAINQAGGGVGLNGASSIMNQNELQNGANNSQLVGMIAEAVAIGSEKGTHKGSQKGIIGLSENRKIMSDAKF